MLPDVPLHSQTLLRLPHKQLQKHTRDYKLNMTGLDVFDNRRTGSQSASLKKKKKKYEIMSDLDQNVFGVFGEPARINRVVCSYGLEQLLFIAAVERRLTDQHLVQQHSERPPVHSAVVLLTQQDLTHTHTHTV